MGNLDLPLWIGSFCKILASFLFTLIVHLNAYTRCTISNKQFLSKVVKDKNQADCHQEVKRPKNSNNGKNLKIQRFTFA